jgi:hypothetical protein
MDAGSLIVGVATVAGVFACGYLAGREDEKARWDADARHAAIDRFYSQAVENLHQSNIEKHFTRRFERQD